MVWVYVFNIKGLWLVISVTRQKRAAAFGAYGCSPLPIIWAKKPAGRPPSGGSTDSMDYFYMRVASGRGERTASRRDPLTVRTVRVGGRIKRFSGKGLPRMGYLDGAYARQSVFLRDFAKCCMDYVHMRIVVRVNVRGQVCVRLSRRCCGEKGL
jgi:hypothetical protein